jgi:hypothetical protein
MRTVIKQGWVQNGQLVFSEPLELPEGTEVSVEIELLEAEQSVIVQTEQFLREADFSALPFFGMWADRKDMKDSTSWLRKERKKWSQRFKPQD